ncbi:alkaline phosphatase family protein [Oxalicibacterium sp.]|uniref:alkaline phosphatase family protein n=1 Tax=Oxalicibacterium sp. TaxID=2766525 RepID=UPI0039C8D861
MQMHINKRINRNITLTAVAAAVSLLAACGGGGGSDGSSASAPTGKPLSIQGTVSDSIFTAGSAAEPTMTPTVYQNAKVCVDANSNGSCDTNEVSTLTDGAGKFALKVLTTDTVIADIGTDATRSDGSTVAKRNVFRVSPQQLNDKPATVAISPFSAEIMRMMEADGTDYLTTKANLAARVSMPNATVSADDVVTDINTETGTTQTAMLREANALSQRYAYAITKLDRKDKYPDDLAVAGGDPRLKGMAGVTQEILNTSADTRTPITFKQSQQAAFNIEGIPRYDHIFIVMLENKATSTIKGSQFAPNINNYLTEGNQLTSYFATGNPSEPNYTALGGADDFGIPDDSQWNCDTVASPKDIEPTAANFPTEMPKSPFKSPCVQPTAGNINHNIVGKRNLFNALTQVGLTWRTYSESMNPGQDVRVDSVADAAVTAVDKNDPTITLPLPANLYKTKHHPGMAYENVRNAPEFTYSNRTLGGGQWDAALLANSTAYPTKEFKDVKGQNTGKAWTIDQFSDDLASGNVGELNFVVPDQCDDMHGTGVPSTTSGVSATDCGGSAIIQRGDKYVDYLVKKIKASPLWNNPQKRIAIVLMFDEGTATGGTTNSCCGWVPGDGIAQATNGGGSQPLNDDGTPATPIKNYTVGNHGHGESIYGILTNQANAPKGVADSDAYSHFSFVRTLQDMFGLSDPADDSTYMNRSKYTEKFIAENIKNLPEYANTANTHFNAVRPINHAFIAPADYKQIQSSDVNTPAQVGPDLVQTNVWALKK